jgi:hypothetical protein
MKPIGQTLRDIFVRTTESGPHIRATGVAGIVILAGLIAALIATVALNLKDDSASANCVGAVNRPGGADPWGGCWPGPQNTGYPHGLSGDTRTPVTLTAYTGPTTITKCGVVIDSKVVSEDIVVTAGNGTHSPDTPCVTIKNSLVKGVIHTDAASYGPVVVTDTEVAVPGLSWWENIGRYNIFVWRVNSHGSEGVIKCADYCVAYDSWVHGMYLGGQYHYNAFGGNGIESANGYFVIEHNWASCGDWAAWDPKLGSDAGCSAAIGFYGDFDPIRNITINRNYLAGAKIDASVPSAQYRQPGYCLNPGYYAGKPYPNPTNVRVTNNIFGRGDTGKCGIYGPTNSLNAAGKASGNVWENNKYEDGAAINRPEE